MLKGLAFRFGQQKYREKDTENAEPSERPKQYVLAKRVLEVAGKLGDEKGQEPAHGNRYTRSLSLDVWVEHLAHHSPRKRAPAHAVRGDEDDERDQRQPTYLLYHVIRMLYILQVEVQAQPTLQNKCPITTTNTW